MQHADRELIDRLRTSVGCLSFAITFLSRLDEGAERAKSHELIEILDLIERQAAEAEAAAAALESVEVQ